MTDQGPEPADNAGINALRLDADRTRDELERTLEEIERRLDPRPRIERIKRAWRNRPVEFITVAGSAVGAIGGLIVWAIRMKSRSSRKNNDVRYEYPGYGRRDLARDYDYVLKPRRTKRR